MNRKIRVLPTYLAIETLDVVLKQSDVVVVDVLRASTSMIVALESGAESILPCRGVDQALDLWREGDRQTTVLAGEREAQKIDRFHLGNSPFEFSPRNVHGKTVIMTTRNGTRALHHCVDAHSVTIGALRNAHILAGFHARKVESEGEESRPVVIVCAGTDGRLSQDDLLGAGAILNAMTALNGELEIDDAGLTALDLYRHHADDLAAALARTNHGKRLINLGREEDVRFSAQEGESDVIPILKDGALVHLQRPHGPNNDQSRRRTRTGT